MKTFLYHPLQGTLDTGGDELLDTWQQDPDSFIWVDVAGPVTPDIKACLEGRFGLHPLAVADASRDRHPPKIEAFDGHTFLLFKEMEARAQGINGGTIQVALFAGGRFLVTRHSAESASVSELQGMLASDAKCFADGPGHLSLMLGRMIVDRYLDMLLGLEEKLEMLGNALLQAANDSLLGELVVIKSGLVRLRRIFHYQVQLLDDLQGNLLPGYSKKDKHTINDLHEQQERARSLSDLYYGLATDLMEGYISVASHRLNQIMRVLTIITAVFVPLGFLVGIYGMNFDYMPELKSRMGYFILLGVMLSIAAGLILFFKKKKWL